MDEIKPRSPSRAELEQVVRRISTTEIAVKEVRAEIERIRSAVSLSVSEGLESARRQASAALAPVQAKVDRCVYLLEENERRETSKREVEAEFIARRAKEEAAIDARIQQRISIADATGRHQALHFEQVDATKKDRREWILPVITAIISSAGGAAIMHLLGK